MANLTEKTMMINFDNINESIQNQTTLYATAVENHFNAMKKSYSAKREFTLVEAELDQKIREANANSGTKMTEAQLSNKIISSLEYQRAAKMDDDARAEMIYASNILETLRQRRDILVQLKS